MNERVKCPYCEEYVDIKPDEHYEGTEEYQCPKCEKIFEVDAEAYTSYMARGKADCLNGGKHEWKQQIGAPDIHFKGKYLCNNCSARRTVAEEVATPEEWNRYFEKG